MKGVTIILVFFIVFLAQAQDVRGNFEKEVLSLRGQPLASVSVQRFFETYDLVIYKMEEYTRFMPQNSKIENRFYVSSIEPIEIEFERDSSRGHKDFIVKYIKIGYVESGEYKSRLGTDIHNSKNPKKTLEKAYQDLSNLLPYGLKGGQSIESVESTFPDYDGKNINASGSGSIRYYAFTGSSFPLEVHFFRGMLSGVGISR